MGGACRADLEIKRLVIKLGYSGTGSLKQTHVAAAHIVYPSHLSQSLTETAISRIDSGYSVPLLDNLRVHCQLVVTGGNPSP